MVVIKAHDSILPTNTTFQELSLLEVQVPTKAELTYEAFHPLRSIPFLIRVACVTAFIIIAILLIRCFWPNFRSWLGRTWFAAAGDPHRMNKKEKEETMIQEECNALLTKLTSLRLTQRLEQKNGKTQQLAFCQTYTELGQCQV